MPLICNLLKGPEVFQGAYSEEQSSTFGCLPSATPIEQEWFHLLPLHGFCRHERHQSSSEYCLPSLCIGSHHPSPCSRPIELTHLDSWDYMEST